MKILAAYTKIGDKGLQKVFKDFVLEEIENIELEKLDYVSDILYRLSYSNSNEIRQFNKEIASQLMRVDDPMGVLKKMKKFLYLIIFLQ